MTMMELWEDFYRQYFVLACSLWIKVCDIAIAAVLGKY